MNDAGNLGRAFEAKYKKPRRLSYHKMVQPVREKASEKLERAQIIFENAEKVKKKADWLLSEMLQIAKLRRIPVDKNARDVRAAVRRKRPNSRGDFIDLDLYLEALEYKEKEMDALDEDMFLNMPKDPASASHHVTVTKRVKTDNIPWKDAIYMASQLFTLAIFKLLQKGTDNVDTQLQTSSKQPSGTEAVAVVAAIAISIVTQLLISNVLEDEVKEDISGQPAHKPVDLDAVDATIGQARETLEAIRAYRLAKIYKNPDDYRLIRDYVAGFLAETRDSGWEEWHLVPDVKDAGLDAASVVEVFEQRVPRRELTGTGETERPFDDTLDFLSGPNSPLATEFDRRTKFEPGQKGTIPTGTVLSSSYPRGFKMEPPNSVLSVFDGQVHNINNMLNKAAAVLSWRETQDAICCMIRSLGGYNTESLHMIREVLDSAMDMMSFDLDFVACGVINQNWSLGRKAATRLLWQIVDGYNKAVDKLWKYVTDFEGAEELMACTPMDELFQYIAGWAKSYLDKAVNFVLKYVDVMGTKQKAFNSKIDNVANMKKIRWFLGMLDTVLAAIDKGELCQPDDAEGPGLSDVSVAAERGARMMPDTVVLPGEPPEDPFSGFVLDKPLILSNGITLSAASAVNAAGQKIKKDHEECLKRSAGETVKKLDAYIRSLNESR